LLPRDGSITILDVRTPQETALGSVEGSVRIPLDELRGRVEELDSSKRIFVLCRSGLRSYIACRILAGYGFDVYNLSGGYRLYESVMQENNVPDYTCTVC